MVANSSEIDLIYGDIHGRSNKKYSVKRDILGILKIKLEFYTWTGYGKYNIMNNQRTSYGGLLT